MSYRSKIIKEHFLWVEYREVLWEMAKNDDFEFEDTKDRIIDMFHLLLWGEND